MSKAFKCDICGEYKDGTPTILSTKLYEFGSDIIRYDICGKCHLRINELFNEIGKENNFINDFNNPDNFACYD